ncbi:MAG: hypothetical protein WBA75_00430 [Sphingopyxis granuli]
MMAAPAPILLAPSPAIAARPGRKSEDPAYSYGHSHPGYRSKGKQARPRKRPNRLHISRRVRRAHRRSKAA